MCKKGSSPACLEISNVAEDDTALLSKRKESVWINLLQNINIKARFVYQRKNITILKIFLTYRKYLI